MSDRFGWTDTSIGGVLLTPGTEIDEFTVDDHALHLGSQITEVLIIEGSLEQLATYLRDLLEQVTAAGRQRPPGEEPISASTEQLGDRDGSR